MLDALITGTRDPETLAELAKGRMRTKLPALREALEGHFEPLHAVLIAEIGDDMSVFPTAGHLASWAGQCPGNDQSAGKRRSGRTRKGSKHLNAALTDAAMAALRTNDSYLQALYRRKKPALGHGRALGAVKHSMLCAVWHILSTGELYNDLGGDYFMRRDPARQTRRLVTQLERLGHTVTLTDTPIAA
jgi:transposase